MHFRYRQAPRYLSKVNPSEIGDWMTDPPVDQPGEIMVALDLEGRLLSFEAVPPDKTKSDEDAGAAVDWEPILEAAGFETAAVTPVGPTRLPPHYADTRVAWTGLLCAGRGRGDSDRSGGVPGSAGGLESLGAVESGLVAGASPEGRRQLGSC